MRTILFLVPDLRCHGYAKQASLLASVLPRDQFAVHFAVLEDDGVFSHRLQQAGIPIHFLGAGRSWVRGAFRLRRLLRQLSPELVQAWNGAVRWAALARMAPFPRRRWNLIAVNPPPERMFLRPAARVVVQFPHDAGRIRHPQVAIIPPAIEENPTPLLREILLRGCGLPDDARFILCAGAIENDHGFRAAVWTFDILKYIYPKLWLLLAGDGPERRAVEAFSRARGPQENRVKFIGVRNDIPQMLGLAELAWICGRRGGRIFALEALAAGCPVVGPQRPEFVELLGDSEAGFLVASDAASEFAKASRRILDDPVLRMSLSEAARLRASSFGSPRVLKQWLDLYADLFSPAGCNSSPLLSP